MSVSPLIQTKQFLDSKKNVLFITTSQRWKGEKGGEVPKSTRLAHELADSLQATTKVTILDASSLTIYPCEGNVSTARGNTCGLKEAMLSDTHKNPSGHHRCWASINNPDDELWIISKALFQSDAVVFFGSIRWGQTNSIYQKLIERLTWLENRHSSLSESNILETISAGIILCGHNWRGAEVVQMQKEVLAYFGFAVADELCWHWQATNDATNESLSSYAHAAKQFEDEVLGQLR